MKSVSEFMNFKLAEGIKLKTDLSAEGKTPEEISAALGEKFKFEGDKLTYFVNALEVASKATGKLYRVAIVKLGEGQRPPANSTIIDDVCYIAEPQATATPPKKIEAKPKSDGRGKGGDRGGKGGGKPKSSPWGVSPEELEAKQAAARQAAREKSLAGKA